MNRYPALLSPQYASHNRRPRPPLASGDQIATISALAYRVPARIAHLALTVPHSHLVAGLVSQLSHESRPGSDVPGLIATTGNAWSQPPGRRWRDGHNAHPLTEAQVTDVTPQHIRRGPAIPRVPSAWTSPGRPAIRPVSRPSTRRVRWGSVPPRRCLRARRRWWPYVVGDCSVAFDAPLVVANRTGCGRRRGQNRDFRWTRGRRVSGQHRKPEFADVPRATGWPANGAGYGSFFHPPRGTSRSISGTTIFAYRLKSASHVLTPSNRSY